MPRTRGIVLMTLAMLSIPLVDGLAKHLSLDYSPLFIGWARYAVASVIVAAVAAAMHGRHLFPTEQLRSHILRTVLPRRRHDALLPGDRAHPAGHRRERLFRRARSLAVVLSVIAARAKR